LIQTSLMAKRPPSTTPRRKRSTNQAARDSQTLKRASRSAVAAMQATAKRQGPKRVARRGMKGAETTRPSGSMEALRPMTSGLTPRSSSIRDSSG
jgi:hypothetical protein